jgi:hypothetical protein
MVIEEPDIEIGAGVSSKGKRSKNMTLPFTADIDFVCSYQSPSPP